MGNQQAGGGGLPFGQPGKGQGKDKKKEENRKRYLLWTLLCNFEIEEKRRIEPPAQRVGRKKKRRGVDTATKLPNSTVEIVSAS